MIKISGAISRVVAPKMADFLSKDLLNVPICMHERQLYTGTELIVFDRENTSEASRRVVLSRSYFSRNADRFSGFIN